MFLLESISNKIGHTVSSYLEMDKEQEEIITYGAINMLHTFFSISLVMIFGFIFHVFLQALIISFTASILRKYSGGVHSASPNRCAAIGTIVCVGFSLLLVNLSNIISDRNMVLFLIINFTFSYYFIAQKAPVDNPAKPIINVVKKQRLKRKSLITLFIMYAIILILFIVSNRISNRLFLVYSQCIMIGVLWQSFTLTNSGHILLNGLDEILNVIVRRIKNEEKFIRKDSSFKC